MSVITPTAKGAWGFLKDTGPIELAHVTIHSENEYGSVVGVSLDSRPLGASDKILIQMKSGLDLAGAESPHQVTPEGTTRFWRVHCE